MNALVQQPSEILVGIDENGLGACLGPLVVTAVSARVSLEGRRYLSRGLRGKIREDLDDSKQLVSHSDWSLGEGWARVLAGSDHASPQELFLELSRQPIEALQEDCPRAREQCWSVEGEAFQASSELLQRLQGHARRLAARGVVLCSVQTEVVCAARLNREREQGRNRFVADLHSMERLIESLHAQLRQPLVVTCGKVGGMSDYQRFFGPLSQRLHTELRKTRRESAYHFPRLGQVRFVQDADAKDPLVMLASLVGKYVRELLMARIDRFYESGGQEKPVSGYHDPRTRRFIVSTTALRKKHEVPEECFERLGPST